MGRLTNPERKHLQQLNSKANPPTLVGGGAWGRRPHTIFIPPTKLVVELRDEKALPQEFSRSIRSEVSFRVLSEVSIQGHGRQDKETTARDDQRSVREDGNRDCAREDHGRSRARVFVGAAEVFSCGGHETDQRE